MFSQQESLKRDCKAWVQNLSLLLKEGKLETFKTLLFAKAQNEQLDNALISLLIHPSNYAFKVQVHFILGILHFYKLIPDACNSKAASYLDVAVKEHHAYACYYRGLLYEAENKTASAQYVYEVAAALNNIEAMYTLACLYEEADDFTAAEKMYLLAAKRKYAPACNNLGWLYEQGYLGKSDYFLALKYYRKGAARFHVSALCNLANIYQYGRPGIPIDIPEAIKLYDWAIKFNSAIAMVARAMMYHQGIGQPISYMNAARLYRQAAQLNHTYAKDKLESTKVKEYLYHKYMFQKNMSELVNVLLSYPELLDEFMEYELSSSLEHNVEDVFRAWFLYRENFAVTGFHKAKEMLIRCKLVVTLVQHEKNTFIPYEWRNMFRCLLNQSDFDIALLSDDLLIELIHAVIDKIYIFPSFNDIDPVVLAQATELITKIFLWMRVCNKLPILEPYNRFIAQIILYKLYPELHINMQSWSEADLFRLISLLHTAEKSRPTMREVIILFSDQILLNAQQKTMKEEITGPVKKFFNAIDNSSAFENVAEGQSLSAIIK